MSGKPAERARFTARLFDVFALIVMTVSADWAWLYALDLLPVPYWAPLAWFASSVSLLLVARRYDRKATAL